MILIACPGQGAQTPGFLEPWLSDQTSVELLSQFSEACGLDLALHGTVSDADTIRDTAIAQPLIVAASLLSWERLTRNTADLTGFGFAGHSVGEIAAAALAGVLSYDQALAFVTARAQEMAKASAVVATGMSATIGSDQETLQARLDELGLSAANYNGGGQIVVAGETQQLAQLKENPPAGFRVIPLQTAGAFHTRYMESARQALEAQQSHLTPQAPHSPIWSNSDGSIVTDGTTYLSLLISQVTSPVRWDLCTKGFADNGVSGVIELLPGGTLTGLLKRNLRGVPSVALKTPADLEAARDLLTETGHTADNGASHV